MKIDKEILAKILVELEDQYPLMLGSERYGKLVEELGGDLIVDAHLLYADDKGYITTEMKFDIQAKAWQVNPYATRLTAYGLDVLSGQEQE